MCSNKPTRVSLTSDGAFSGILQKHLRRARLVGSLLDRGRGGGIGSLRSPNYDNSRLQPVSRIRLLLICVMYEVYHTHLGRFPGSNARQQRGCQLPNGTSSERSRRDVSNDDLFGTAVTPAVEISTMGDRPWGGMIYIVVHGQLVASTINSQLITSCHVQPYSQLTSLPVHLYLQLTSLAVQPFSQPTSLPVQPYLQLTSLSTSVNKPSHKTKHIIVYIV